MDSVFFDDLKVGDLTRTTGRTITDADVVLFAGLTGDHSPLHLDETYATEHSPFGGRIAHGALVSSVALGLLAGLRRFAESGVAALGTEWTFIAPVRIGDTVRVEETIAKTRLTSDGHRGVVHRNIRVLNQHGATVQEGAAKTLIRRRESS